MKRRICVIAAIPILFALSLEAQNNDSLLHQVSKAEATGGGEQDGVSTDKRKDKAAPKTGESYTEKIRKMSDEELRQEFER